MADGSSFPHPLPPPSAFVEEGRFRDAMSLWASGVAVATCPVDGVPFGLTISSFTSLSVHPPRVLFCIAESARCSPAFRAAGEVEDPRPSAEPRPVGPAVRLSPCSRATRV